jgi:hypothetical protein
VAELFSKFKRFTEIVDLGNAQVAGLVEQLAGSFSALTDGFKEFMKMQGILTQIVGDTLGPAIREAGRMFSHVAEFFAPMLNSIEILSSTVGDIAGPFQDLIDAVDPLKDIIKGVAAVFNIVSLTILGTIYGVETMFAQILKGIRNAIGDLFGTDNDAWRGIQAAENKLDIAAGEAADKMNQIANHLGDAFAAGSGVGGGNSSSNTIVGQLNETTQYMQLQFVGVGDAAKDAAANLGKFSQEFSNLPQGFKYALRAYQAMDPTGTAPAQQWTGGTPGAGVTVNISLAGVVGATIHDITEAVQKSMSIANFRTSGVPHLPYR